MLKRLQPRLYSISSSPLAHPARSPDGVGGPLQHGRRHAAGVCSTFLADRRRRTESPVFVQRIAHFRPPRRLRHADDHGRPGHRHRAVPRLPAGAPRPRPHRPQLAVLRRAARGHRLLLPRRARADARRRLPHRLDLAFSRDQRDKVYVQDRMREHGAQLWSWLQDGAHFYVCGDATRWPRTSTGRCARSRPHSASSTRRPRRTTSSRSAPTSATSATCTSDRSATAAAPVTKRKHRTRAPETSASHDALVRSRT